MINGWPQELLGLCPGCGTDKLLQQIIPSLTQSRENRCLLNIMFRLSLIPCTLGITCSSLRQIERRVLHKTNIHGNMNTALSWSNLAS